MSEKDDKTKNNFKPNNCLGKPNVWKNQIFSVCSNCETVGVCWFDDINGCYRSLCCGRIANDLFINKV